LGNKKPKVKDWPSPTKTPTAQLMPDFNAMHPAWHVARIDFIHPDDWKSVHQLDANTLERIRQRLASFETMTWKQIIGNDSHPIEVHKLCKGAKQRLENRQIDASTLVSLRCTATARIWGIRRENVLSLLWWDPNHQVYPVEKKNT
jgi:hypothetical protein